MPDIQINVARYTEDKKLGLCKLIKINGQTFYSGKEYDRTGKPIVVNAPIATEALKDALANVEREITDKLSTKTAIAEMIADVETAEEVIK